MVHEKTTHTPEEAWEDLFEMWGDDGEASCVLADWLKKNDFDGLCGLNANIENLTTCEPARRNSDRVLVPAAKKRSVTDE